MSMNPEQLAAREKFEEAMRAYLITLENPGLLIDWMLVAAEHHTHDGGDTATSIAMYVSEGQSVYRTAGLAAYAKLKTDERMAR